MVEEVKVRVGTPEDLEGCMELFIRANEENGIDEIDRQKLFSVVLPSLNREGGMIGVIGERGYLQGVIMLRIESLWYGSAPILFEKLVFVHPDFRSVKGGRARKLCEFSKQVSDELEIPLIAGISSNERTRAKIRMYERMFGAPVGAYFLYNGKTGRINKDENVAII